MFIVFFSSVLGTFSLRNHKLSFCLPFFPILGILPSTVFLFLTFYNDIFVGVKGVTALMFYHTLRKDHENTQRLAIFWMRYYRVKYLIGKDSSTNFLIKSFMYTYNSPFFK